MPVTESKERYRPLKVYVTPSERQRIHQYARNARMSVSTYLRVLGLNHKPKSMLDQDGIRSLVKLHADQGRLGGLLKLWLATKPGQGVSGVEVRALYHKIEALQLELSKLVRAL